MNQQQEINNAIKSIVLGVKAMENAVRILVKVQQDMAKPKLKIIDKEK